MISFHNQLEQIHLLRQEVMGRILWEPKTKKSNVVQVIWKKKQKQMEINMIGFHNIDGILYYTIFFIYI